MAKVATILIPYSPEHKRLSFRAIESARNQSIPCDIIFDESPLTPAHVRNYPLNPYYAIKTPFVVWLDADDWLERDFVEQCLKTYKRGHYVYTGWYEGDFVRTPPACNPFANASHHIVTTLYPTEVFKYLGGFDVNLPGYEDIDLYLRSARAGLCGILCNSPLVHYTGDGQRGKSFAENPDSERIRNAVVMRNGGERTMGGCCGAAGEPIAGNPGDKQEGDVLAQVLWSGMRTEVSWFNTARVYRGGNHEEIWVDPRDVQARPSLFRKVIDLSALTPSEESLKEAGII